MKTFLLSRLCTLYILSRMEDSYEREDSPAACNSEINPSRLGVSCSSSDGVFSRKNKIAFENAFDRSIKLSNDKNNDSRQFGVSVRPSVRAGGRAREGRKHDLPDKLVQSSSLHGILLDARKRFEKIE